MHPHLKRARISELSHDAISRLNGIIIAMEWEEREWCGYTGRVSLSFEEEQEGFCGYLGIPPWVVGKLPQPFTINDLAEAFVADRESMFGKDYDPGKQYLGVRRSLKTAMEMAYVQNCKRWIRDNQARISAENR